MTNFLNLAQLFALSGAPVSISQKEVYLLYSFEEKKKRYIFLRKSLLTLQSYFRVDSSLTSQFPLPLQLPSPDRPWIQSNLEGYIEVSII